MVCEFESRQEYRKKNASKLVGMEIMTIFEKQ